MTIGVGVGPDETADAAIGTGTALDTVQTGALHQGDGRSHIRRPIRRRVAFARRVLVGGGT